jgi:RimJ/RimL family protein N-acetyltransferase
MPAPVPFPDPALATGELVLRTLRVADYAAANRAREDAESARWVNALPQPDGERLVAFFEQSRLQGRMLHLAIAAAATDEYYGEVLIFLRTAEAGEVGIGEIAYVIAPSARGRGIASDAVALVSRWAFDQLHLERLQLSIHPDNEASKRVAVKSCYEYEGTLRSTKVIRGRRVDSTVWSLLPSQAEESASSR